MLTKIIFNTSKLLKRAGVQFDERANPAVIEMEKTIRDLGSIQFKAEFHPDGSWTAESTNIDGIITGGANPKEMNAMMKDAVFTYFKVPPHFSNDTLLRATSEPVTVEQRVWATH